MDMLAVAGGAAPQAAIFFAQEGAGREVGFQINLFWIIAQALSFLLFVAILYFAAFRRIGGVLEERRARIEQGLRDADAARVEREQAATERQTVLTEARREANEIVGRSQRVAEETRQRELEQTRAELQRLRDQATTEIDAERARALTDVRQQVADLALRAASRVVGETMNQERERRLVQEFLVDVGPDGRAGG